MPRQQYWSTIIQEKIRGKWFFFSQQCWLEGDTPMSDDDYLKACQELQQTSNELRIRPGQPIFVHAGTLMEDAQ